jgi:DNA-binding PadR family transcriptional regulator
MAQSLGEFEQLLLFALVRLDGDASGVALRREIEQRTGREVSAGAVYTALERLEARRLVRSSWGQPTAERGGKRKKLYRIEPLGVRVLGRSYTALQQMARGLAPKLEA